MKCHLGEEVIGKYTTITLTNTETEKMFGVI